MAADKGAQQWDDKEDEEGARGGSGVSSGQRLGSRELLFELRKGILARASWIDSPNPMLILPFIATRRPYRRIERFYLKSGRLEKYKEKEEKYNRGDLFLIS